jgi:hypothetical protein
VAEKMTLNENPPQNTECPYTKEMFILGRNNEQKSAIFFNPACGMWSCPVCGERKKEDWVHQAARGSQLLTMGGNDLQFVTLTSRSYATPNKSIYFFKQNWPKLRKRIAYYTNMWEGETGRKMAYFMVPERHKSGVLHSHMVVATHIRSKTSWKKIAWETGFGYILDVQNVDSPAMVANYIAKYLGKHINDEQWPKGFMHVRHSQNWPMARETSLDGWLWDNYRSRDQAMIDLLDLQVNGWNLIDRARKE